MPGKQLSVRRLTNGGAPMMNGQTPERPGMAKPPRFNEPRHTATSSSTFGSHTTAASRTWTEK